MATKPDQYMDADRVARGQCTPALATPCIAIAPRVWCSTRYALALAAVAFAGLPSAALAASVEDSATVTVIAGRLTLVEAPAGVRNLQCARGGGYSAVLPSLQVVDATGSGRGWRLTVHGAAASVRRGSYNGPAGLAPRAGAGAVVAYASRNGGMGTTVLRLAVFARTYRVTLRFVLTQGPA